MDGERSKEGPVQVSLLRRREGGAGGKEGPRRRRREEESGHNEQDGWTVGHTQRDASVFLHANWSCQTDLGSFSQFVLKRKAPGEAPALTRLRDSQAIKDLCTVRLGCSLPLYVAPDSEERFRYRLNGAE